MATIRLIDANALEKRFTAIAVLQKGPKIRLVNAICEIHDAPTVDAVPVVHGEWLVEAYNADDVIAVIPYKKHQHNDPFCSRCKTAALTICGEYVASNYCPHCGAKMDGCEQDE